LDVRPKEQRDEWQIPGSVYVDAYKRLNAGDNSENVISRNNKTI